MTYAFIRDIPINESQYREVQAAIGDETPKGLIAHLVFARRQGSATSTSGTAKPTGRHSRTASKSRSARHDDRARDHTSQHSGASTSRRGYPRLG